MTKPLKPIFIEASNLSLAWAAVVNHLAAPGVQAISPLTLSITGFDADGIATEVPAIRAAADALLAAEGKRDIENVAFTIFPERYWKMSEGNRDAFFDLFRESFPRIQEFNPQNNRRGSYFQRLVDFEGGGTGWNQLKWILAEYDRNPGARKSKWQATTFDPKRDQSSTAQLEFPCLQQVSFTFSDDNDLVLNAFYATQQLAHKGYGNYLGLGRLGAFMASQMGRRFDRLNVFVGVAKMDKIGKTNTNLRALLDVIRRELASTEAVRQAA